jgi:hypothetical protein
MYVAVKGGEAAIANAHALLADRRRGDRSVPALRIDQIVEQLGLAVDRVMGEGSLYDKELAALALVKQARGDLIEAIFLVRAYRTTLPRFGYSQPIETGDADRTPHFGDLQGPARRADARADLRLYSPPARSLDRRWRCACADRSRGRGGTGAARH